MFTIQRLNTQHQRAGFCSASEPLNRYLQQQVNQDTRRLITSCFVASPTAQPEAVAGYYTLASASIVLADLPPESRKKLPRYPTVPAVRLGRLAVDQSYAGQGLGAALLLNAVERIREADIAAYAVLVNAKDAAAAAFYQHHGFMTLDNQPLQLFLALADPARAA
jgi:ribosomal protein S18 acetylase RimI-like enzyme